MVVNIARLEWRANCSSIDVVAVSFGDSRAARMEFRRHFFRGKNADGAGKNVIQRANQIVDWNGRIGGYGGNLSQSVDAGVGAARALREGFFAGEVFESGHQRPLNGQSVRLDLPSGEVVAIVSEREFEISWQIGT
jgi:hypothetical protein